MTVLTYTLNTNIIHSCISNSHILLNIHTHCNAIYFKYTIRLTKTAVVLGGAALGFYVVRAL